MSNFQPKKEKKKERLQSSTNFQPKKRKKRFESQVAAQIFAMISVNVKV